MLIDTDYLLPFIMSNSQHIFLVLSN